MGGKVTKEREVGSPTRLVCDDAGNNLHYTLAEVDSQEAVVIGPDERYQRLTMVDLKNDGVEVHRDVNDNPVLKPGQKLTVQVGKQQVVIEGTSEEGILFNEVPVTMANTLDGIRYPRNR